MEKDCLNNFEYVNLTIPQICENNILNGAIRFINDLIEVWVEGKMNDYYANLLSISFKNDAQSTILITRKNGATISCFNCLCTNTKINSPSFVQSPGTNEPSFQSGYFRFKTNCWIEGATVSSEDKKVFSSFHIEFEYLSNWLNTAPEDRSIIINSKSSCKSEIAKLKEIKFISDGTGSIECNCFEDKISANDAAWNALYLQILLKLLSGIAIPKAKIILIQDAQSGAAYLHSHVGQPGLEPGLNPTTIIPKLNLGMSCEQLYSNPDVIINWLDYCYKTKDISAMSLITIGLNNTSINERMLKQVQAFDVLSFNIDEVIERFDKKEYKRWLSEFCGSLDIQDNQYGITRNTIQQSLAGLPRKSLKTALKDFIEQNEGEIFEDSKNANYLEAVNYIVDYRNAVSHGRQKDVKALPEGYSWQKLFTLMYKVNLLLIKKYILNNDKLYLCTNNDFRFIFERKRIQ